jgi:hypothetical protein
VARSRSSAIRAPLNDQKYFKSFDDIVDHCRYVWITLIDLSRRNHVHRAPRWPTAKRQRRERFSGAGGRSKKFKTVVPMAVATAEV